MEVHHHPSGKAGEKKKFKEYFFEFVMIFLAVTLGFFAESYREGIVNKEKEIHHIKNLVADLMRDTADVGFAIRYQQNYLTKKIDSSLHIPIEHLKNISSQDSFYHYFLSFYTFSYVFYQNNNTISQLKTAGGFSVIRKKDVIDSISDLTIFYDRYVKLNGDYYITSTLDVVHAAQPIMKLMDSPTREDDPSLTVIPNNIELFTSNDKPLLQQLYNRIVAEKANLEGMILEKIYQTKAESLINFLKQQYHLK